ncbi:MAG TPA: GGDEF domain-containing protein, partial [Negativicutes bacterium]|nr:GGDEF domain-containing protein [Negativicutes bacterium]
LWKAYLHNISDKGFNYTNVAAFLPDEQGLFTVNYYLRDGKLYTRRLDDTQIDTYIQLAAEKRDCMTSSDKRKVALPMLNHFGALKAVLVAEKETGFLLEDLELLDVYIQQTIATIENVSLNERLLHYQDLLGKRLDQFVLLHYLAKEINEGIDYYNILKRYLSALQSPVGFNFKNSNLYIIEEDSMKRARLVEGELHLEIVELKEGLILDALEKRCGALSADNKELAMPLLTGGKVCAVMEIENEKEISLEKMQILEIFALQTSSMLDNARLRMHLEYMSYHDALTGLYNRAYFEKQLRTLAENKQLSVGMMMCDVNELKYVNDTIGHHAGDLLIVAAARAIKQAIGVNATVARIGGDEFAVLISPCEEADLPAVYAAIQDNLRQYNTHEGFLNVSMAIGWAFAAENADLQELFRWADRNMYTEKQKAVRRKSRTGRS